MNWAPLLPAGRRRRWSGADGEYVVVYTDHFGLLYDPTVVAEADVPRSIKDLAQPALARQGHAVRTRRTPTCRG